MMRPMRPFILVAFALAAAAGGCGDGGEDGPVCGDGACTSPETAASCASDCGCGNGAVGAGEACDGADLGGATCESLGFPGGTLACDASCALDPSGCVMPSCGNGVVEGDEACDGADLGGATCESVGFSGGALTCDDGCELVVGACCNDFCAAFGATTCDGDLLAVCTLQPTGCLAEVITDCGATDDVCDDRLDPPACVCIDRCSAAGIGRCAGAIAQTCVEQPDGCLDWEQVADCAAAGQACAVAPDGATCVAAATGEDCTDPYPITPGSNVIGWTASVADYLTFQPSCNTGTLTGPDLVLTYTAGVDGLATFTMPKPASARQVVVVSAESCGSFTTEVACVAETAPTSQSDTFEVTLGTTYHFYVRDTTTGTALLANPLLLSLEEVACDSFTNPASNLSPANSSTVATTTPTLSVDVAHPINPSVGVITITGTLGTDLTYDLATAPAAVVFTNGGRTMTITPAEGFAPGETVTVGWSGMVDATCGASFAPPAWTFAILTPACAPGVGGMVGTSVTRLETGIPSFTENYVAADAAANGWVYVGGSTDLYRIRKAGGALEDVTVEAGISSTPLGSAMAIVGGKIFTLDTVTATTSPFLWRLSTSGGVTWNALGYGEFPVAAGASARGIAHHGGRLYLVTDETTVGAATEIWSVNASAILLPDAAVLEGTITGEGDCDGIAVDDHYFYLACADVDHVVRVDRTTFAVEVLTDAVPLNLTKNEVHADDFDGDGAADALYVQSDEERVHYVCAPAGVGPFWRDILVDLGTGTGNFGLGFDAAAGVLWTYDDDTGELVSIQ
jgi:hypothetical protein